MSLREKTEELRAEALKKARECAEIAQLIALDDAVVAMGGNRITPSLLRPVVISSGMGLSHAKASGIGHAIAERISQGDATEIALKEHGEPLPIGRLQELAIEKGARIGGNKPTVSFRSMLSKDNRFYSLTRNNMYFWWLSGVDLPSGWLEPKSNLTSIDDLLDSGSDTADEEGGDGLGSTHT